MATKTDFLELTLPANNEFNNTWDTPINENFQAIDLAVEDISNEIQSARFATTSLAAFLQVAHFSDGTLKPSDEQDEARNSPVYGDDEGGEDFTLTDRLDKSDFEIFYARENEEDLLTNLARRLSDVNYPDRVIDGPKDNNGAPNFLSSSGAEFLLNGDPEEILLNIDGYLMKIRDDISVDVTGADGVKYLTAKKPATPFTLFDRSTQEAGATTTNALNNDKVQVLQDTGQDYANANVRPGMILRITNTQNAGDYVIDQVGFDGNADQLLIRGVFPSAIASINYVILDPLRPEFEVVTSYTPTKGVCYIGQGEFASGSLISDTAYAFKGKYESPYTSVDVSTLPNFNVTLNHNLGYIPKKIHIYATETNDGESPHEPLSFGAIGNDLAVAINNTLVYTPEDFTPGVFDAGTTDASYTEATLDDGSLDGDVTGSLSGQVYPLNAVRVRFTRTQILIKNVRANLFYRDFDGTDKQTGFLKVVCE